MERAMNLLQQRRTKRIDMATDPDKTDPQPSEQFAADLAALDRAPFTVPRAIDDAVLRDARTYFARQRSRRMILRIGALVTAAAAVIVVVVHLSMPTTRDSSPAVVLDERGSKDAVDIVDALNLAKRIRAGGASAPRDDVNRDGAVDQRDVDAIAMAAVKLPEARVQ